MERLTYFPNLYHDELWRGALIRYGQRVIKPFDISNTLSLLKNIYLDDSSNNQFDIIDQLPNNIFDKYALIWEHTLLPYKLRLFHKDEREHIFNEYMTKNDI